MCAPLPSSARTRFAAFFRIWPAPSTRRRNRSTYFFTAFFGGAFFAPAVAFLAFPLARPPLWPAAFLAALTFELLAFGAAFLAEPVDLPFVALRAAVDPDFPIPQRY